MVVKNKFIGDITSVIGDVRAGIVDDNHLFEVVVESRYDSYRDGCENKFIDYIRSVIGDIHSYSTTTSKRRLSSTDTPIPALTYKSGPINNRSNNKNSTTTSKRRLSSTDTPIPALTYKSGPINNRSNNKKLIGSYWRYSILLVLLLFIGPHLLVRAGIGVSADDNHLFEVVVESRYDSTYMYESNLDSTTPQKGDYRQLIHLSTHLSTLLLLLLLFIVEVRFVLVSSPNAETVVENKFIDDISRLVRAGIVDDNHLFEVVVESRYDSYRTYLYESYLDSTTTSKRRLSSTDTPIPALTYKSGPINNRSNNKKLIGSYWRYSILLVLLLFIGPHLLVRAGIGVSADDNHLFEVVVESRYDSAGIVDDNHLFEVVVESRYDSYRDGCENKFIDYIRSVIGDIHSYSTTTSKRRLSSTDTPIPALTYKSGPINNRSNNKKLIGSYWRYSILLVLLLFIGPHLLVRAGIGVSADDNHLFEVVVESRYDSTYMYESNLDSTTPQKGDYRQLIHLSTHLSTLLLLLLLFIVEVRFVLVSSPNAETVVENKFIDDISRLVRAGIVDDNHLFEVVVESRYDSYRTYLYESYLDSTTTSKRRLSSTDTPIPALTYKSGPINNRSNNKKLIGSYWRYSILLVLLLFIGPHLLVRAGIGVSADDNHLFEVVVESRYDSLWLSLGTIRTGKFSKCRDGFEVRFVLVSSPNAETVVENKFIDDISRLVRAGIVDDNHLFEVVVESRYDSYRTYLYESYLDSTTTSKRRLSSTDTPIPALTYKSGPINNRSNNKKLIGSYWRYSILLVLLLFIGPHLLVRAGIGVSVDDNHLFEVRASEIVDDNHLFEVVVESRYDSYRAGIGVSVDDNHLFEVVVESRYDSYRLILERCVAVEGIISACINQDQAGPTKALGKGSNQMIFARQVDVMSLMNVVWPT
ncbi:hypothetical protein GQR58_020929 [Nymphon striatum]|nr:hypothetical protein GQR58_020929 [Nymphon striatum]